MNSANADRNTTVLLTGLQEAAAIDFLYATDSQGRDRSTYCWSEHFEAIYCATAPSLSEPKAIVTSGECMNNNMYIIKETILSTKVYDFCNHSTVTTRHFSVPSHLDSKFNL